MQLRKKSTKDLVHPGSESPGQAPKKPKEKNGNGLQADRVKRPLKDLLKSKLFLGAVCLVIALLLAFAVVPFLQTQLSKTVPVVVLREPVPAGMLITDDMLSTKEMGAINLPVGTVSQAADAVGKYLSTAGLEGDILTLSRLSDHQPADDPNLSQLPSGKLAMSVPLLNLEQSVSAKLRAGDIIQLFAVLNSTSESASNVQAPPELQRMEVLAVTNQAARDIEVGRGDEMTDSDRIISTVTLAVNGRQALTLAGLNHDATLYAALVTRGDPATKAAALAEQESYFAEAVEDAPSPAPTSTPAAPPSEPPQAPLEDGGGV